MKRWIMRIPFLRNKKGMTLVELIVTMALLGIFMTAATVALSTSVQVFDRMKNTGNAFAVSDMLLDKISGELAGAGKRVMIGSSFSENDAVAFYSRTGSPVYMTAEDGQLLIHYYPVLDERAEGEVWVEGTDWTFDSKIYQGLTLSLLRFEPIETNRHLIRIVMELTDGSFVSHEEKIVECTNWQIDKIETVGAINRGTADIFVKGSAGDGLDS